MDDWGGIIAVIFVIVLIVVVVYCIVMIASLLAWWLAGRESCGAQHSGAQLRQVL